MKKIYTILFAVAALFAFAPSMSAQDVPFPGDNSIKFSKTEWEKPYEIKDQVGYRKIISKPNNQGIYHILLDAFTTGREVTVNQAVKSDIVLVLDISGSMNDDMSGNETTVEANKRITALKNAVKTFIGIIDDNDTKNAPSGERLGNRIAIVPYSHQIQESGVNQVRPFTTLDRASDIEDWVDNLSADGGTYADLGMQRALKLLSEESTAQIRTAVLFTDGNPGLWGVWTTEYVFNQFFTDYYAYDNIPRNYQQAYDVTGRFYQNTLSHANNTINYASQIKALSTPETSPDYNNPTKRIISSVFTVSVITNPTDQTNVYLGKTSSNWKSDAKSMGNYTVSPNGSHAVTGWKSNIWENGDGTRNTTTNEQGEVVNETKYAITAQNAAQLEQAFTTIAQSQGENYENLGETSVATVDIVSASFNLPSNAKDSDIKVYTAKCGGVTADGQPTFTDLLLAPTRNETYVPMKKENGILVPAGDPKDVDDLIPSKTHLGYSSTAQEATGKKDKITVEGFDYSNNWCGEVIENGEHKDWHGYKVTILIPIKMNPDALGGVGTETNDQGSGIFINGENRFPFTSPKVNLPVNIVINKQGLDKGESSKFTILRKSTGDWEEVTSVFVTRHEGQGENDPRTRIEGLPATDADGNEYIYKVREDNWSWSYTLTTGNELTTEDNDNPFTFKNEKKNGIDIKVRHAESKATNTFKTDGGDKYDDSKTNNDASRTIIEVTSTTSGSGSTTGSN